MQKYLVALQKPDRSVVGISWQQDYAPTLLLASLNNAEKLSRFLERLKNMGYKLLDYPNRNAFIDASCTEGFVTGYIFVLGHWLYCDGENFLPVEESLLARQMLSPAGHKNKVSRQSKQNC